MNTNCPICLHPAPHISSIQDNPDILKVSCPRCGRFRITESASATDIERSGKRYLLSAAVRNRSELNEDILLTPASISHLLDGISLKLDPFGKIDLFLQFLLRKASTKPHHFISINFSNDYPLLFLAHSDELHYYLDKARELNLVEKGPGDSYRLSLEGWRRLSEIHRDQKESKQVFVAMWFDKSMEEVWVHGFKAALDQVGYHPIRIDLQEHNEKICDRIISEIRKSGLVVADFTGQRGGVYFEAGFALGLSKTVIWTCQEKDIKKLHFDTRQYNHIVWTDAADLKNKLIQRIEATIPRKQ